MSNPEDARKGYKNFNNGERPKVKIVKYVRFTLDTEFDLPDGTTTKPTLRISWRGKYPRFTVFTRTNIINEETGKADFSRIITAPFDPWVLKLFIKQVKGLLTKKEKGKYKEIDCYNTKYVKGERTNEKYLQATVKIGINDDGVVCIMVKESGKDEIEFTLDRSILMEFYTLKDDNGNPIKGKGPISRAHSELYFDMLDELITEDIKNDKIVEFIDPPGGKKPFNNSKPSTAVKKEDKNDNMKSNVSQEKDKDLDLDAIF